MCTEHGVLLVCDEVIAGMGRTGRLFATEFSGIRADFITVSKGLSSGYAPIAACLVAPHITDVFVEEAVFRHGHTYAGHPVAAAGARAVLSRLKRDRLWERAEALGERLLAGLRGLSDNLLYWDARGRGLLAGLEIVADGATGRDFDPVAAGNELRQRCLDKGLLSIILHPGNILFLAPPLVVSEEELDQPRRDRALGHQGTPRRVAVVATAGRLPSRASRADRARLPHRGRRSRGPRGAGG